MPALSIITINLNNRDGLKNTIKSVFSQTFSDLEYIIIDGRSTDGSLELIESKKDYLAYWVSEKDQGTYDAMNKGIARATGDYIMFLNSGDFLYTENVLSECFALIYEKGADIYYGDMIIKNNGRFQQVKHSPKISLLFWRYNTINHQSAFYKRKLFSELGLYDLQFRVAADQAFHIKAYVMGKCFQHINVYIVYYDIINSSTSLKDYKKEALKAYSLYIPPRVQKVIFEHEILLKLFQQRIIKVAARLNALYQDFRFTLKQKSRKNRIDIQ